MFKKSFVLLLSLLIMLSPSYRLNAGNNYVPTPVTAPESTVVFLSPQNLASQVAIVQPKKPTTQLSKTNISKPLVRERLVQDTIVDENGTNYPLRSYVPAAVNDPFGNQWWTEQTNVDDSWDFAQGEQQLLAVIDGGFALDHEEFSGRFAVNVGESGTTAFENPSQLNCTDSNVALHESCNNIDDDFDGIVDEADEVFTTSRENPSQLNCSDQNIPMNKSCNLIDDDNNGLVDDATGWDFANFDRSVQTGEVNPSGSNTTHGTLVTGVAAATGNNSKGIAGVDWHTEILPIQILDDDSNGNSISLTRAIRYAIAQGADVINLSLGSFESDEYVRAALSEAIAADIVVVAATGNEGCVDCILYPAAYPEVVAVGAHDNTGAPASFSNGGEELDIMAPGVGLYTTSWQAENPTSTYSYASGTSLATPVVSGIITRARAQLPQANTTEIISAMLENTSKDEPLIRHSQGFGFGRLHALNTLNRVTYSISPTQIYSFVGATAEINSANLYDCGGMGPIRMYKNSNDFAYDGSNKAKLDYAPFADFCALLPHDTPTHVRHLNIRREFSQKNKKY